MIVFWLLVYIVSIYYVFGIMMWLEVLLFFLNKDWFIVLFLKRFILFLWKVVSLKKIFLYKGFWF